ncbi:3-alpha,7-alpha,12-alpha-trihydroxy-5-beta-cholest-24-enoyl-CoAhydratase [Sphingobium chlorophenolicum L-1]|uniref:3-alpha,7-alpha, 12-alpha-trihydroxy-5-beta-cholest-24-enoyl-CoAhydratase n=2 Tax=Sphingobium chlorophenolicum TaxID=46429 RepID=F6F1J8_SPHCR|nr:3-alpha,7-alpha,12-alpha-trihydroxy-5-beta-cholest-24-enoyl-CoAhydratase [Sphingobium chlorophenolicum L-1]
MRQRIGVHRCLGETPSEWRQPMTIDPAYLLGLPPRITHHNLTRRDTILYALGVGAGHDPDDRSELSFVYEDGLQALPTMPVVLAYPGFWQKEPSYGIDWKRLLHGEQSVTLHAPLPVEGELRGETTIDMIVDKGADKGALLYASRRIYDSANLLLATVRQVSFLRGDGGCGGPGGQPIPPHPIPERPCDATATLQTRPEQALLYRLSGDYNPLHLDPVVAAEAGLPRPILHGLCTFGVAGRAVLKLLCGNDSSRLKRLDCRFTAPTFPGDAIRVSVWREGPGRAAFQADVPGRNVLALNNGYVEFEEN